MLSRITAYTSLNLFMHDLRETGFKSELILSPPMNLSELCFIITCIPIFEDMLVDCSVCNCYNRSDLQGRSVHVGLFERGSKFPMPLCLYFVTDNVVSRETIKTEATGMIV